VLGPRWLARGFDPDRPDAGRATDAALLAAVAFAAIAALSLVGALLATALLVVPAATTRLWFDRLAPWQVATVALAAIEGVAGIWLAVETNAPPGATIAVLAGGAFTVSAVARVASTHVPGRAVAPSALALTLALASLTGCGSSSNAGAGDKLAVVATTTHVADFARAVGGERVQVTQLLQPNSDPHNFEPRPGDVRDVATAKVMLVNGLGLDAWAGDVVKRSGGNPQVVDLGAAVPVKRSGSGHAEHGQADDHDPHWFHDPRNARAAVERIRDVLASSDPSHAGAYRANASAYLAKLQKLDSGIERCFASVPRGDRKLVTDHDAFGYFTDRYGIQVVGAVIPSQTTQAQPSARDTANLARLIERENVKAIFAEESLSPKLARALADQTGATAEYHLYGDSLGPKGSPGATYLSMEHANADAMVRGFTGGKRGCTP
jgi:zinc/manganese transport system substrate-binding protein